jgi:capsid protein
MGQVNDRTIRVILQDFRRSLEQLQWQVLIYQFCRPIWNAWFDRAVLSGALTVPPAYFEDPEPWRRVEWAPDRWPYINPVQDVEADIAEIRGGLASRSEKAKERGRDIEEVDRRRAEDKRRENAAGLVSEADPGATSRAGVTQARPPDSAFPEATE